MGEHELGDNQSEEGMVPISTNHRALTSNYSCVLAAVFVRPLPGPAEQQLEFYITGGEIKVIRGI